MGLNTALTPVAGQPDVAAIVAADFTKALADSDRPLSVSPNQLTVRRQRSFEGRVHPDIDSTGLSVGLTRVRDLPAAGASALLLFLTSQNGSSGQWSTVSLAARTLTPGDPPFETIMIAPIPYGLAVGVLIRNQQWLQIEAQLPDGTVITDSGTSELLIFVPIESATSGWPDSDAPLLLLRDRNGDHIAPPYRLTVPKAG